MLRKIRIAAALAVIIALTLVFADFSGASASHFGFLPKYQLVPALLAMNFAVIAVLALITLIFGRLYCSVLCPTGILQDIANRIRHIFTPKRKRRPGLFKYTKEKKAVRYCFFGLFLLLLLGGLLSLLPTSISGLLEPYSIFGRAATELALPVVRAAAAPVIDMAADKGILLADSYPASAPFVWVIAIIAAVQILIILVMAWRGGRDYCNTVCPVGTLLGFLSRFSLLRPCIDLSKCNNCGSCGRHCKAECINTKAHEIDYSRCVVCFDCIEHCTQGALRYRRRRKAVSKAATATHDGSRRAFLTGLTLAAGTGIAMATDKAVDGGLAPLKTKTPRQGITPAVPAGAISIKHLRSHCTACQLCVSACPSGVLKPSLSADGFMQPKLVFTNGYCRTDCTACSDICPAGAIVPINKAEKTAIKIGTARVDTSLCISAAYGQRCGNCSRHCPTGAINMVIDATTGNYRPAVDAEACIGCGACEYHCPSGTAGMLSAKHAAIYVEGIDSHRII